MVLFFCISLSTLTWDMLRARDNSLQPGSLVTEMPVYLVPAQTTPQTFGFPVAMAPPAYIQAPVSVQQISMPSPVGPVTYYPAYPGAGA